MIQFIRGALSSWLVLGLLGLVLVAFVVTGIQDPFGGAGGTGGALAKVGDAAVTEQEFARVWQRQVEAARERDPNITGEALARAGGVEQLLDELIAARAAESFGRSQGVRAGNRLIDSEIAAIPAFQLAGRFDQNTYEGALQAQRLTDREVRESLEGDIIRRQLIAPIAVKGDVPAGVAEPYARMLLERREGLIGVVPAGLFREVPVPTDADLQAFYTARRSQLTIPERRSFRYALIDPAMFAARVTVSEADIAKFYADNAARYGGTERRSILQAALPDEAAAKALAAAVAGQEPFDVATQRLAGLARADIALGELTRAEFQAATDEKTASAVFSLPSGGVTPPLATPFGWRIYKVDAIAATAGRPLADVRGEIEAELRKTRAQALEAEVADKALEAVNDGATFGDVAKRFGLTAVQVPPVTRTGLGAPGFTIDANAQPLIESAFNAEPGEEPSIEDLGQGRAALFEMGEVTPPTLPPFAQVRAALAGAWAQDWQARRAARVATEIVEAVKAGTPMAQAFAARGLPAPQPVGGRRIDLAQQQQQQIPPPVLLFFEMPRGAVRTMPAPGGQGAFVVQVGRTAPGNPAEVPPLVEMARRQFGAAAEEELTQQFAQAARAVTKVSINTAAVARLRARLSGQADSAGQ